MRFFKYKNFAQLAKAEKISDEILKKAISEIDQGLYEVHLGANLYKKRVARKGQGKSGSYRVLIAYKYSDKAFFIYGYAKHEKDNLGSREKEIYKKLAKYLLEITNEQLELLITKGHLWEVI